MAFTQSQPLNINPKILTNYLICTVQGCNRKKKKNIAMIAKAALHKLPGKSSLIVSFVRQVCPVRPVRPVRQLKT